MAIERNVVTVSVEDAELHIRSGFPGDNYLDWGSTDTSVLRLAIDEHVIEVWFVNLDHCKHHIPLIRYVKRQMGLMLLCFGVALPDFEIQHPLDAVPWITDSQGHKVIHLENLAAD